jgi:ParB/RepB/Spo0J family partition protein
MEIPKQEFVMLDPRIIKIPCDHCRKSENEEALKKLARSIKRHGMVHPITVVEDTWGGYVARIGIRRLKAAIIAGINKVPCLVADDCPRFRSLVENEIRNTLDPIDRCDEYQRLLSEMGVDQKVLAEELEKSPASICATLSLRKLSPEIVERHRNEKILSEKQLIAVSAKATFEEQEKAYDDALTTKRQKKSKSLTKTPLTERITNKVASLMQAVERLDPTKINLDELKDLNPICDRLLLVMIWLLKSQNGKSNFNPNESITGIRQLVLVLAEKCGDEKTMRAFIGEIKEIDRSVRKICAQRFYTRKFWKKLVWWV